MGKNKKENFIFTLICCALMVLGMDLAKIVNDNDPLIKKVLLISFFMVCGMCFCMSLIVSIVHMTTPAEFPLQFVKTLGMNFICALPLQLIIVGPIARGIFFKMYPTH